MKRTTNEIAAVPLSVFLGVFGSACASGHGAPPAVSTTTVTGAPSAANGPLDDPQVVDLERALFVSVAEPAQLASTRATYPRVKQYAAVLYNDYTTTLSDEAKLTASLGMTPQPSDASREIAARSNKILSDLDERANGEFDRVFAHAVSTSLQRALDHFDYMLLPSVREPHLRSQLLSLRPKLWSDLTAAVELEGWLATQP